VPLHGERDSFGGPFDPARLGTSDEAQPFRLKRLGECFNDSGS